MWQDADIISTYSRAQAIDDGCLVDVSELAREAGFRHPVAVTRALWCGCVEVPAGCEGLQDETGRLWDVLWMLSQAVRRGASGQRTDFSVIVVTGLSKRGRPKHTTLRLKALCGPGDTPDPVITIMLPNED